ncbi:MAG: coenzyme F420-0:L-glutamate ligase [Thermoproteota archaeon]
MGKYKTLAVVSDYWRPGEDYLKLIIEGLKGKISDGDFVVISEKAISIATGQIFDEETMKPSLTAKLIARYWMRLVWGYILGPLCKFGGRLLGYLRRYPLKVGSRHKQFVLNYSGFLPALMFGSEGGIDGSNLPYAYVSLPLVDAGKIAEKILRELELRLGKKVWVMIVDTDKTYSFKNFHFTPRPTAMDEIHSFPLFLTYVLARALNLRRYPTPLTVKGSNIDIGKALRVADIANRVRGVGAGKMVWDMAERFDVDLTDVSWDMLETVKHKPLVIIRKTER